MLVCFTSIAPQGSHCHTSMPCAGIQIAVTSVWLEPELCFGGSLWEAVSCTNGSVVWAASMPQFLAAPVPLNELRELV